MSRQSAAYKGLSKFGISQQRLGFAVGALLVFVALGGGSSAADGATNLVWHDEFDGTTVDSNKWKFEIGTGPPYPGWGNSELEYYTRRTQNVYVANGLLHIVARAEAYEGASFTSARLKNESSGAKKYGRFEFRAKLPAGLGYWPAIWMMPQNSVYGGWPRSGEIDVVENRGAAPTKVQGTIHYANATGQRASSRGIYTFPSGDAVTNFHTYTLQWTSHAISWSVDGQVYQTQTNWSTRAASFPAPFDQPFYIIMNLAVGGGFIGSPTESSIKSNTVFPGEMQIDYVRIYDDTAPGRLPSP
ncbi:MAG TPA: glycoside hydrolase family 16 protein [Verrucomicrobiae bacterium]|nr:glycoside hydrolase family 16 protein [Verrucomicrobiae bacterium]